MMTELVYAHPSCSIDHLGMVFPKAYEFYKSTLDGICANDSTLKRNIEDNAFAALSLFSLRRRVRTDLDTRANAHIYGPYVDTAAETHAAQSSNDSVSSFQTVH